MSWEETLAAIREGLRAEIRRHWGRISEIEATLSMRQGQMSDLYSARTPLKLDDFCGILDALGLDAGSFFTRTLGTAQPKPEQILDEFAIVGETETWLSKVERATLRLETSEPPEVDPDAEADPGDVADVAGCSVLNQQRRLRHSRRYRTHAFASAYLQHLDSLRYDDAETAAKLAVTVMVDLVPKLPGPQPQRLALQCLALGIFGSARRVKGRYPASARAFQLAIEVARRNGLLQPRAELLQRASYLLKDFGQFERALDVLREALETYVDLDCQLGIGKTLVDRGMMLWYLGRNESVVRVIRRALGYLTRSEVATPRTRFAAYQFLAYAFQGLGELDTAERALDEATAIPGLEKGFYWAKLRWMQGSLAFKHGQHARAESLLLGAREALASTDNPGQEALVSLDLLDAQLAQGKLGIACGLAQEMARLLDAFEANPLAQQAIIKLIRPALTGKLTRALVGDVRTELEQVQHPGTVERLRR